MKEINYDKIILEEGEYLVYVPFSSYRCTNYGRIFNRHGEQIFNHLNQKGYLTGTITVDGISYSTTAQRVIALAFNKLSLEDFKNYSKNRLDIDHVNCNRLCNHIDNLQVLSHKDNALKRDALNGGAPMFGRTGARHARSKPVLQYDLEGNFIKEFESGNLAAKELNIHQSSIAICCSGKIKQTQGFIFKYKEEN